MKSKLLITIMTLLCAVSGSMKAQGTLVGSTPIEGESYYLYSTVQQAYLNDEDGFDTNPTVLWSVGGTLATSFTLTSDGERQFAMYRSGNFWNYQYNITSSATGKSGSDVQLAAEKNAEGLYAICRASKSDKWSGNRNVASTPTGLAIVKDASNEWIFVNQQEIDELKNNAADGGDLTALASKHWEGQTGNVEAWAMQEEAYVGIPERYSAQMYVGDVMTQTLTGLKNGTYRVVMHGGASTTGARDGFEVKPGQNHAYFFANDALQSLEVYSRVVIGGENGAVETAELTCTVTDGTLKFGIQNITEGANWFVLTLESITYVSESVPTTDQQLAVGSAQWSTFIAPFDVTVPAGVKAYTVDDVNESGDLGMTEVSTIDANTPVLLYAESPVSTTVSGVKNAGSLTYTYGLLTGTYGDLEITEGYVMQKQGSVVGFYVVSADNPKTVPANKAYLTVPASEVKAFQLNMSTSVKAVEDMVSGNACIHDLNGRKLNKLQKGINVVNGVKILVK